MNQVKSGKQVKNSFSVSASGIFRRINIMGEDVLMIKDFMRSLVKHGWEQLHKDLCDVEVFGDILQGMVGEKASKKVLSLLDKASFVAASPTSQETVQSTLSLQLGGIMHFVQSGAGTDAIPQNRTIYPVSDLIPDPSMYGSVLLILKQPIPYGALAKVSSGIRRPTGWAEHGWHLTRDSDDGSDDEEETNDYSGWIPADTEDPTFNRVANTVAIQGVMISIIPVEDEKDALYVMTNNPRMAVYLEARDRPGVGTLDFFPGIACPQEKRPVVVSCNRSQLYQLLSTASVPWITKFYSVYANVLRFTARAICTYADKRDFVTAAQTWHVTDPPVVSILDYQVAVASYLLGACYTIRANAPGQIAKRLSACRASLGDDAVTEKKVADFMTQSGFKQGLPNSTAAEIVGIAVAITGPKTSDPNARRKDLMSVPAMITEFGLDRFTAAMYTQLRLVAESLQSSTIRFALAGLVPLGYVWEFAPDYLQGEAKDLRELKPALENRPYTGCVDPIPAQFTIANCPHMSYYGVEAYRLSLTPDQKEKFEQYNTNGIVEKLGSKSKSMLDAVLEQTPKENAVVSAEYMQKLPLELAEPQYTSMPEEKREQVKALLMQSATDCALKTHLMEQKRLSNLISRISFHEQTKVAQISGQLEDTSDERKKTALRDQRSEFRAKYAALRAKCEKPDASWTKDVSPEALDMHQDHYNKIKEALKRVEAGGPVDERPG